MRKMHRLPNGFGSIKKLSGARRKPYAAYPPTVEYHDNGSPVSRKAIGYFETWKEAFDALTKWNANPVADAKTFKECFDAYYEFKFNGSRQYSKGTMKAERSQVKNCKPIYDKDMTKITVSQLQKMVDDLPFHQAGVQSVVNVIKQVFNFAEREGIIVRNPARFLKANRPNDDVHGVPFTAEEIEVLWQNKDDNTVMGALAMIYSGFRISAMLSWEIREDTIYGGVKTGKRTVPIHRCLQPFIRKFKMPSLSEYRRRWDAVMKKLNMNHTPHDCRHTFSWLCDTYGVDTISKHMLMGHSLGKDVEAKIYSHRTLEQLTEEINKICC